MVRTSRALGKHELPPKLPVSEAIEAAKTIVGHFRDGPFTDDALASALGYGAVNGGAFRQKVADLRKFGVVTGRGAQLGAGPIAQAIFADRPGEREKARLDMVTNIPIFKVLHELFGDKVPDDASFSTALLNITGAARPDIESSLVMLRDAYRDACSTIPAMGPGTKGKLVLGQSFGYDVGAGTQHDAQFTGGRFESSTSEYQFSVADDAEAIDSLIDQLESRKKALGRRQSSSSKRRNLDDGGPTGRSGPDPQEAAPPAEK